MIDPALAFQTAIRAALIECPAVSELVPPGHVRAGAIRPDRTPAIVLSDARTEYLGRASGGQRLARVSMTLHIWAQEDGPDTARRIGAAVHQALEYGPKANNEITVDEWNQPSVTWLRDPQPELAFTHGIVVLDAAVRWRASA